MDVRRLIEILENASQVDQVGLRAAVMEYERWGNDIARSLLDKRAISEAGLVQALARVWGVPGVDLSNYRPSVALVELLSSQVADEHRAIPLKLDGSFIDVAFAEPSPAAIDAVRVHSERNVRAHVGGPRSIDRLLAQYYGRMSVAGYDVDPRVTSGNFLSSDVLDLEAGEASMSIPVDVTGFEEAAGADAAAGSDMDALVGQLDRLSRALIRAEQRIQLLEAHVGRDEDVLRRLFGFMVDKGVGTREEIVKLLR